MEASSKHAAPLNRAGTAQLLAFSRRPVAPAHPGTRSGVGPATVHQLAGHFTLADRLALAAWGGDPAHGYERLRIERDDTADVSYALAYAPGTPWSAWGVTRRGGALEVWRCATGKTLGRYETMQAALAALPHACRPRGCKTLTTPRPVRGP